MTDARTLYPLADARTLYPLADCNGVEVYDGDRIESRSTKRIATLRYRKDDRKWTVDIGGHVRPFIPHNEEGRLLGWKLYQPVHVERSELAEPVKPVPPDQERAIDKALGMNRVELTLDDAAYLAASRAADREGVIIKAYLSRVLTEFLKGSIPGRQPDGYAYEYPAPYGGIRFSNGERVNGSKPLRAVPYFLGYATSLPPLPPLRRLASGVINGKRVELRGLYEDDLKRWLDAVQPPTGPSHRCDGCGSTTVGVHFMPCNRARESNE